MHGDPDESRRTENDESDAMRVPEGETPAERSEDDSERSPWGDPELL